MEYAVKSYNKDWCLPDCDAWHMNKSIYFLVHYSNSKPKSSRTHSKTFMGVECINSFCFGPRAADADLCYRETLLRLKTVGRNPDLDN